MSFRALACAHAYSLACAHAYSLACAHAYSPAYLPAYLPTYSSRGACSNAFSLSLSLPPPTECVEDDTTSRSNREGRNPGCILDYRFDRGMRATFLWHAASNLPSWQATRARLASLMAASFGRRPSVLFLGIGAWDMQLSPWPGSHEPVDVNYALALAQLAAAFSKATNAHEAPMRRIAYGNWICTPPNPSDAGNESRGHYQPAGGERNWPRHNWPSRYARATWLQRDHYRAASERAGWLWLDVEQSHRTMPAMRASPCGNQHPFGALAEAHIQAFLGILDAC